MGIDEEKENMSLTKAMTKAPETTRLLCQTWVEKQGENRYALEENSLLLLAYLSERCIRECHGFYVMNVLISTNTFMCQAKN